MLLWVNILMTAFIPWSVLQSKRLTKKMYPVCYNLSAFHLHHPKNMILKPYIIFIPNRLVVTATMGCPCWKKWLKQVHISADISMSSLSQTITPPLQRYEIHFHAQVHNLTGFSSWWAAEDSTAKSSKQNSACTNNFRNHLKWVLLSVFWLFSL